ncbi:phosphodiester glycosidase family protein [Paenibacillus sp. GCM10012307]
MINVKSINRLGLLACAPFAGMLIWLLWFPVTVELSSAAFPDPPAYTTEPINSGSTAMGEKLDEANGIASSISTSMKKTAWLYNETNRNVSAIAKTASKQAEKPLRIYDNRISSKLGKPAQTLDTDRMRAQLFYINAENFKGYALKVRLKSGDAMSMTLGNDKYGGAETTLAAVQRMNAAAGINAGGFADQKGSRYPLSTTIVDGEYVNGFEPSFSDLFFVGINKDLKLVGNKYNSRAQLDKEQAQFGASFVPILLKDGSKQTIPPKWQTSPKRAARTVIANYKDDQLLFLVTDAADERGNSGASLAELQILLQRYGAINAYNLDGGGSSTLVFNGKVINKPSDGTLRKLATNFLLFS